MKKSKIFITSILVFVMSFTLACITACGPSASTPDPDPKTVLTVSLNPSIELILDEQNKVVTVNALNDDGNVIVSAQAFQGAIGLTAEDAVKLFVSVSKEHGYLLSGSIKAGENQLDISISGDTDKALELYQAVKEKAEEEFEKLGVSASVKELQNLTRAQLDKLLLECLPYMTEEEVAELKDYEVVDKLIASRLETAKFYSEQLKLAFYESKKCTYDQARLTTLSIYLDEAGKLAVNAVNKIYTELVEQLVMTRGALFVAAESPYQQVLAAYQEVKAYYNGYRNYVASLPEDSIPQEELTQNLAAFEAMLKTAEEGMAEVFAEATAALDLAIKAVDEAYNNVLAIFEEFSIKVSEHTLDVYIAGELAVKEVAGVFTENYEDYIAEINENIESLREYMLGEFDPDLS